MAPLPPRPDLLTILITQFEGGHRVAWLGPNGNLNHKSPLGHEAAHRKVPGNFHLNCFAWRLAEPFFLLLCDKRC